MFANTPGFLDVSKKKKKGKKRATNKITAPLPRNLQEPVPLESDNEDGFEEQNNSEGESLMREGRKTKSVFTQLAEQEKKKRRDLSLEGASESDDPTWNVVPQKTLKNGEAAPVKTALSSGANSAVFDTEDSHDVTDGEKNEMIQKESVRQGSVKPKRRGKKTPTLEHNSEDEDEMMRKYQKSCSTAIPNIFEMHKFIWKFMKQLDWRVLTVLAVTFGVLCALKIGEESYIESRRGGEIIETNLYEVLKVPKSATKKDIERSYRKMTIEWHPDRNPDCPQCLKKFQEISHAYATLANKESREIYDKSSSSFTAIDSSAISLTSENFDEVITDTLSHKVWVIQTYTDLDGLCRHVAPAWEDAVIHLGKSVGFARINARTTKKLVSRLPVKVRIYPTIIMLSESQPVETYQNIYQMSASNFRSWIVRHFPTAHKRLYDAHSIESFLQSGISMDSRSHLLVTSPHPSLPFSIRSQLHYHKDLFESAHTLIHEAKALVESWDLVQPDRFVNIIRFPFPDENLDGLPKPIHVYSVPSNSTEEDVANVFRKIRRSMPARLTLSSSPALCGNENDPSAYVLIDICLFFQVGYDVRSVCIVRILDSNLPASLLQLSTSKINEEVPGIDEECEPVAKKSTGYEFFAEATGRVSTAAQVLMHGTKTLCNFDESSFWGHRDSRRHLKRAEDEESDSDITESFIQLAYMSRPTILPNWLSAILSWIRPLAVRHPFFACHDIWGSVLRDSDLFLFQRSSGRLLPLQRVETALTTAVEIASDIFNGFVDIDVSSQLRSLSAAQSADWRGVDLKEQQALWDSRLLSCSTPITVGAILKALSNRLFASKFWTFIIVGTFGSFVWRCIAVAVVYFRDKRNPNPAGFK